MIYLFVTHSQGKFIQSMSVHLAFATAQWWVLQNFFVISVIYFIPSCSITVRNVKLLPFVSNWWKERIISMLLRNMSMSGNWFCSCDICNHGPRLGRNRDMKWGGENRNLNFTLLGRTQYKQVSKLFEIIFWWHMSWLTGSVFKRMSAWPSAIYT
jgi:hypothetical protein